MLSHGGVYNPPPKELREITEEYEKMFPGESFSTPRVVTTIEFLVRAIEETRSTNPLTLALAMEGMEFKTITGNTVKMRADDHQLIEPIRISTQSNDGITQPMDANGFGMKTVFTVDADVIENFPHQCEMKRPAGA